MNQAGMVWGVMAWHGLRLRAVWLAVAGMALLMAGSSSATLKYYDTATNSGLQVGNATWDTGGTNVWCLNTTGTNLTTWADNDDARFQVAGAVTNIVTLNGTILANSLTMGNGCAVTLNGGTLQLGPGGVTNLGSAAILTVNSPMLLAGNQIWTNGTGNSTLTFNGSIGESVPGSGLTIGGVGPFTLTASNTYSGGTYLPKGGLYVSNGCALGSGPLTLSGGTLTALSNGNSQTYLGYQTMVLTNDIVAVAGKTSAINLNAMPLEQDLLLSGNISGGGLLSHAQTDWINNHNVCMNLGGDNSGFTGIFSNTAVTRLTSASSGSASARWITTLYLFLRARGATFRLGTLEGPVGAEVYNESGTNSIEVGALNQDCTFNGALWNQNSQNPLTLVKVGSGTLTMTGTSTSTQFSSTNNYYAGGTVIRGGTVSVSVMNSVYSSDTNRGPLGVIGQVTLDGGTLQYIGSSSDPSNRKFTLGSNGGGLDASGFGALLFTNHVAMLFTNSGPRMLTLSGSSTASNLFALGIGDSGTDATSLTKGGAGLWLLTGTNRYSGATSVTGGTLWVEGSLSNSAVTVTNATLGGTGVVAAAVVLNNGGHLAPGHGTGSIKVGSLSLNPGAFCDVQIAGTNFALNVTEQYSRVKVAATGGVVLGSAALTVNLGSYGLTGRERFGIIQNESVGAVSGTFLNLPEGTTLLRNGGCKLNITYKGTVTDTTVAGPSAGNDVVLYATPPDGTVLLIR